MVVKTDKIRGLKQLFTPCFLLIGKKKSKIITAQPIKKITSKITMTKLSTNSGLNILVKRKHSTKGQPMSERKCLQQQRQKELKILIFRKRKVID